MHRFVPHAELLPGVSVFVGHGGHGAAMTALAHDVPVVVLPLDPRSDHRLVGTSLERAGAGRLVDGPDAVAGAVLALLAEGPHRAAAARLGAQVRSSPGARGGADALEAALAGSPRASAG